MMKVWIKLIILFGAWVYQQFVLQPYLWSAKDDVLVFLGFFLSALSLPYLYYSIKWSFKNK